MKFIQQSGQMRYDIIDGEGINWQGQILGRMLDPLTGYIFVVEVLRPGGQWTIGANHSIEDAFANAIIVAKATDKADK
jgi:hypothetical protein